MPTTLHGGIFASPQGTSDLSYKPLRAILLGAEIWAVSPWSLQRPRPTVPACQLTRSLPMPRYLVERPLAGGWQPSAGAAGASRACSAIVNANTNHGVTWLFSYVAPGRGCTYCVCDGPSPEAIRLAARDSGLPVDRITEVRVLDPYFAA